MLLLKINFKKLKKYFIDIMKINCYHIIKYYILFLVVRGLLGFRFCLGLWFNYVLKKI